MTTFFSKSSFIFFADVAVCPSTTYKNVTGPSACSICPNSAYSPEGATSISQCSCPAGYTGLSTCSGMGWFSYPHFFSGTFLSRCLFLPPLVCSMLVGVLQDRYRFWSVHRVPERFEHDVDRLHRDHVLPLPN